MKTIPLPVAATTTAAVTVLALAGTHIALPARHSPLLPPPPRQPPPTTR